MDKWVKITKKRLAELEDIEAKFECLVACGVDNWSGYSDAIEMYEEESEE